MDFLDRYDRREQPVARKVLLDLAAYNISVVQAALEKLLDMFPGDPIAAHEAVEIAPSMVTAEQLLGWATGNSGEWPWDTADFHDFWTLGGDNRELGSMAAYIARMPEFYAVIAEASTMPGEYGSALIEGIPGWHN